MKQRTLPPKSDELYVVGSADLSIIYQLTFGVFVAKPLAALADDDIVGIAYSVASGRKNDLESSHDYDGPDLVIYPLDEVADRLSEISAATVLA
jgi:hypothetical protein